MRLVIGAVEKHSLRISVMLGGKATSVKEVHPKNVWLFKADVKEVQDDISTFWMLVALYQAFCSMLVKLEPR